MSNPAKKLEGLLLGGEWLVGALRVPGPLSTGGNFCQTYLATSQKTQKTIFVKALDFTPAFAKGANQTRMLQDISELFNFEVLMLEFCGERSMDRVVRALGNGTADVDSSTLGQVPYLLFEAADRDVRAQMDLASSASGLGWKLRSLHHITTGIKQLHGADVVHQDLKPSNVVVFDAESKDRVSKVADLGRASRAGTYSPFDSKGWPGDPNYAPPEVYYSFVQSDWHQRRIAYDLYMLGSLISFMFSRVTATAALWQELPGAFWPPTWGGTFEEVLPYLESAFVRATSNFAALLPNALATDLIPVYGFLCQPDPRQRGYPGQMLSRISLERFVTRFDVMAVKADRGLYGAS